jgi:tellurite resistance protein TerC
MEATFAAWVALAVGLVALLLVDLLVVHRGAHEISMRDAAWSTAGFIAISLAFGGLLGIVEGRDIAAQFLAGYLLEKSLSLDNVFVWALIFSAFSIPAAYQHRVLFYGVFGALVLRGAFVAAGAELLALFEWVVYVFGALLVVSGARMLRRKGHATRDRERDPVVRMVRRHLPTTRHIVGAHLFVREREIDEDQRPDRAPMRGGWYATPMLAVLLIIEGSDILFAVDSIPAIFGVTREPFLVYSATALALLGLRSMYFLLAGARDRFVYLDLALAVILVFVGAKFLLTSLIEIPVGVSLLVIVAVMALAIAASLLRSRRQRGAGA